MDRILFGDNQFFGVNHMSEDKARAQAMKFQDLDEIMAVLRSAYENDITTFMCTTHARIGDVIDRMKQEPEAWRKQKFYPCMPYAHKYANAMSEEGMFGAIKKFLPDGGFVDAALRGTKSLASKDIEGITTLLIDAEMKMFEGFPTPVIFLQNVVVDLLLGLGFKDAFAIFADHVKTKYNAEPGFITMNLPLCLETLEAVGVQNPIICSNINKIGFRMSGGVEAYEEIIATRRFRPIAMSVFASGALDPGKALEWLADQGIQSFVFGASSERNIASTRSLATSVWGKATQ